MIGGKDVAKSRKSFNQENQGADSGGLGGAYCAMVGACFAVKFAPLSEQ